MGSVKERTKCIDCGKPLDRVGCRCVQCNKRKSERTRQERIFYKKIGVCPICRKVSIGSSESRCPECRAKETEYKHNIRHKDDESREKYNSNTREWQRKTYKNDKENGVCPRCRKRKSDSGYVMCGICRAKTREAQRERRNRKTGKPSKQYWIEHGLCCFCGQPTKDGYKVCEKHYKMNVEKSRSQKANEARKKLLESGILY